MLVIPAQVGKVYVKHKETWTAEEKRLVHEKLNLHGINDGVNEWDQAISEIAMMLFVDGLRKGRETCDCQVK
jgi:hypothetical protein